MLPASLLAKAIQLCAAGMGAAASPAPPSYAIMIHAGAVLRQPAGNDADAVATVRDLIALGADFDAGPLAINGRDFATFGVSLASVFDACALARIDDGNLAPRPVGSAATVSNVTALVRRAFGARITNTIRPMNASYGARYSWHKVGQAIDFVPAAGVGSITREQIRALMGESGVRVIELLGPGDRGHATHWHVAFARPGQVVDRVRPVEEDEDWMVDLVAGGGRRVAPEHADASIAPGPERRVASQAPAQWDVFAAADWRAAQGGAS